MTQVTDSPLPTIDATPTPPAPPAKKATGNFRKWRNRAIVVVMAAIAVVAGVEIAKSQVVRDEQLDLGTVTLTSQSIPVETSQPGLVTTVDVLAGQRVTLGQQLGSIEVTTTDSKGSAVLSSKILTAPRTGIVVDDPMTVGATLQPGVPFAELYDPTKLLLQADVPLSYLPQISAGMTAQLRASGLSQPVKAVLQRAVPRIGSGQDDVQKNQLELVFIPADPATVAKLIPGLTFTGKIDTRTGASGTPRVVFVG